MKKYKNVFCYSWNEELGEGKLTVDRKYLRSLEKDFVEMGDMAEDIAGEVYELVDSLRCARSDALRAFQDKLKNGG